MSVEKIEDCPYEQLNFKRTFFLKLLFLTLKVKFIYSTSTDLENSFFLKSKIQKNFYIFIQHSTASLSMIYGRKAFLEFDAVQVINKNQHQDLIDINKIYGLVGIIIFGILFIRTEGSNKKVEVNK